MKLLLLGYGKTGSLVGDIARERGHEVRVVRTQDNSSGVALAADRLKDIDVAIDFTSPHAVLGNIEACTRAGKNMVVGTTGWYDQIPRVRALVENAGTGFVFGANFSVGVNLFFEAARALGAAAGFGYEGQIVERHHIHKKDKPSGTAIALNNSYREGGGRDLRIDSIREGDVMGDHILQLSSPNDMILLSHSVKSRRGFADGAVRAAEWIYGKTGFHDFKDIFRSCS
jgi:4-hydroxy-tetrahydrodipicolinate reductase